MTSLVLIVFRQLCVMSLLIALGWLLSCKKIITAEGNAQLSGILTGYIVPAVIFVAFLDLDADLEGLKQLGSAFAVCLFCIGLPILVSRLLYRKPGLPTANAINRCCATFTNNGFFGIPLVEALFGSIGVFYASINVMCSNLFVWTWGVALFEKDAGNRFKRTNGLKAFFSQHSVAAAFAGLFVFFLRLWPLTAALGQQSWFEAIAGPFVTALNAVKNMNTPVAMLVLGGNIFAVRGQKPGKLHQYLPLIGLRQFAMPLLTLALLSLIPLDRTMIFAMYVEACCPIALMISVLAMRYGSPAEEQQRATLQVVFSTVSALVTLPFMVWLGGLLYPLA